MGSLFIHTFRGFFPCPDSDAGTKHIKANKRGPWSGPRNRRRENKKEKKKKKKKELMRAATPMQST